MDNEATLNVLGEVLRERISQDAKWGVQSHPPGGWLAILVEEVGEVATEVYNDSVGNDTIDKNLARMRAELIQVAAVAVAAVENLDREWLK